MLSKWRANEIRGGFGAKRTAALLARSAAGGESTSERSAQGIERSQKSKWRANEKTPTTARDVRGRFRY
ncbi:hypothetical protein, partial [Eggerthella lenta]|uniref:hypothetical protein n=1 Tax=Eggerthella lenta TaxID=84112 RepID=UPI001E3AFA82